MVINRVVDVAVYVVVGPAGGHGAHVREGVALWVGFAHGCVDEAVNSGRAQQGDVWGVVPVAVRGLSLPGGLVNGACIVQ